MPHMHVEYSQGIEAQGTLETLCRALHAAMVDAEIFPLAGISRSCVQGGSLHRGRWSSENDFVAMTLSVGAGRTTDALKDAGDEIFSAAQKVLAPTASAAPHFALSLEIRVSNPDLTLERYTDPRSAVVPKGRNTIGQEKGLNR